MKWAINFRLACKMKTNRQIPRAYTPPLLSEAEETTITRHFFYTDPIPDAGHLDLLLVFGTSRQHAECASKVTQLLTSAEIQTLVLTGGIPRYADSATISRPEAELIHEKLDLSQFTGELILENKSQNTKENLEFTSRMVNLEAFGRIGIITKNVHVLRAYLTSRMYFDKDASVYRYSYSYISSQGEELPAENWNQSEYTRTFVASELARIKTYGVKGDLDYPEAQRILGKGLLDKF